MTRCRAAVLASLVAFAGAACARSQPASGARVASPPASPRASASSQAAGPTAVPVALKSEKVGARYIYLTKQKGNRKVYVLRADSETGQYFGGNTGRSDFVRPHVTFFGRDGRRVVADAPAGTLVEREKTVNMSGGVRARTADGKTLASDTMRYNDDTDTLYGDGNVIVTTPQGERLEGSSLVWNMRDGRLDVAGAR